MVAAKSCLTEHDTYARCNANELSKIETALTFVPGGTPSTGPNTVSVAHESDTVWTGAALEMTGICYYIKDDTAAGTSYGQGTGPCTADQADVSAASSSWSEEP